MNLTRRRPWHHRSAEEDMMRVMNVTNFKSHVTFPGVCHLPQAICQKRQGLPAMGKSRDMQRHNDFRVITQPHTRQIHIKVTWSHACHTSHITRHTKPAINWNQPHLLIQRKTRSGGAAQHVSRVVFHTSHVHVIRHTSHITRHTSYMTHHTSHFTHHLLQNERIVSERICGCYWRGRGSSHSATGGKSMTAVMSDTLGRGGGRLQVVRFEPIFGAGFREGLGEAKTAAVIRTAAAAAAAAAASSGFAAWDWN